MVTVGKGSFTMVTVGKGSFTMVTIVMVASVILTLQMSGFWFVCGNTVCAWPTLVLCLAG